ncbi:MAG TPA: sulfatase [Prolixibacteraceae bacterium]|nr:sulfatase [Prolixibacteraceae bacterium]
MLNRLKTNACSPGIKNCGIVAVACLGLTYNLDGRTPPEKSRPNIVLINVDDMGWRDVGFMGSTYYETPNVDKLAKMGMVFTSAYAGAANCAPSRACLMTGNWTPRHGIYTVDNSDRGKSVDRKLIPVRNTTTLTDQISILPEILHQNGYVTCLAGKWHLSDDPLKRGFDVNIGGSHAGNPGSYYPPYTNVPSLTAPSPGYNLTDLITDKTLDFIRSTDNEKPFFLYYAPYAVHTPIQAVKNILNKYTGKPGWNGQYNPAYATMIENLDTQIGRLIDLLEKSGKSENTFILFTSDNGGVYGITSQSPLRAGKGSPYEGGIREPMIAVWKGKILPETRNDEPITQIDFFPTLLQVAGIEPGEVKEFDGLSIMPLLTGKGKLTERPLYWHFPVYLEGGNKECQDTVFRTRPGSAIRLGDWKLIQYFENNDLELYDLKYDIGEKNNLSKAFPVKTKELLGLLERWRKETGAPVPVEQNPEYKGK